MEHEKEPLIIEVFKNRPKLFITHEFELNMLIAINALLTENTLPEMSLAEVGISFKKLHKDIIKKFMWKKQNDLWFVSVKENNYLK